MSIRRIQPKLFCVYDEVGLYARFVGTYAECKEYVAAHS